MRKAYDLRLPQPLRILIVDDEASGRFVIEECLEALRNFEIARVSVNDGQEAIDLIAKERFDLIVTDLRMPTPGDQVVRAAVEAGTPCVVVTILTEDDIKFENGARPDAVFLKVPFDVPKRFQRFSKSAFLATAAALLSRALGPPPKNVLPLRPKK
jgi:CheY-like chemotaxis protein